MTKPPGKPAVPQFQIAQAYPTPPPDPISLDAIWPPEEIEESPSHGGSGWTLLVALVGTLVGFFLLFWRLAIELGALLERSP